MKSLYRKKTLSSLPLPHTLNLIEYSPTTLFILILESAKSYYEIQTRKGTLLTILKYIINSYILTQKMNIVGFDITTS